MRCKRHTVDFSSTIGVCASCLRERLLSLAASTAASESDDNDHHHRHSRISPPPLVFPRSVSPYVAPRKSDAGGGDSLASSNSLFFATPQVGSTTDQSYGGGETSSEKVFESGRSFKTKRSGLSRFSNFFRTRSDDYDSRKKLSSRESCDASTFSPSSSSSSRSWLSKVLSARSKKQSTTTTCYIEDLIAPESDHHRNRPKQRYCRGMSPAENASATDCERESVEESPGRRQRRTPATETPGRRKITTIGKSVSGMAFCLSPLVRAKPNSSSNWKGKVPSDFGYSGELKPPAKPHISTAASYCGNRSKKLVDLGRVDHRR